MTAPLRTLGLVALLVGAAAPAHGRLFVGIGPVYPWPYPYYSPPPAYYPAVPPPWVAPDMPPPGWVPGHWERYYDGAGRPYDVWVPPHLR
jgi:hypothetical protein